MSFGGKVAIVTGAAMGNGRAIALGLAEAGAHIVAADVNLELARETCREVEALGRRTLALVRAPRPTFRSAIICFRIKAVSDSEIPRAPLSCMNSWYLTKSRL